MRIDPDAIFPEALWRKTCTGPGLWRVETPGGPYVGAAHALEVVDGVLRFLDAEDNVLGELPPGVWISVKGTGPATAEPALVEAAD